MHRPDRAAILCFFVAGDQAMQAGWLCMLLLEAALPAAGDQSDGRTALPTRDVLLLLLLDQRVTSDSVPSSPNLLSANLTGRGRDAGRSAATPGFSTFETMTVPERSRAFGNDFLAHGAEAPSARFGAAPSAAEAAWSVAEDRGQRIDDQRLHVVSAGLRDERRPHRGRSAIDTRIEVRMDGDSDTPQVTVRGGIASAAWTLLTDE
ncbi:hypothetical protein [Sphingosinithalassobacter sp. CS137]|uniref:hypothetical protein n=1 Tax=Sphingosinithalassobacter sp. CS137 TaxID=2762748 RepID=UPI00165E6F2F|nr:hypothetical protein [Sphingosinithalassobacter sp. CS137]